MSRASAQRNPYQVLGAGTKDIVIPFLYHGVVVNESDNSQHVEQLKKMIAENEQMRKELKEAIEQIEGRLNQKTDSKRSSEQSEK